LVQVRTENIERGLFQVTTT